MGLHVFLPDADLADYLEGIWVQEIDAASAQGISVRILPGMNVVICVQYRAPVWSDTDPSKLISAVTGIQTRMRTYFADDTTGSVVARFTPWGAAKILQHTMRDLADVHFDLRHVFPAARVAQLEEELFIASSAAQRAALLQCFIREHTRQRIDPLVCAAVEHIRDTHGALSVVSVAQYFHISERQLERRFVNEIGVTPKVFSRIVRFQHVMHLRQNGFDWHDAAYTAGYFDQAHLINEFKVMAGQSPHHLTRAAEHSFADIFDAVHCTAGFSQTVYL